MKVTGETRMWYNRKPQGKLAAKRQRAVVGIFQASIALRLVSRNDSMLDSSGGNHRSIDVH